MNKFEGKRILVVGGAGFVGTRLIKEILLLTPEEVIIVDNLLSSERVNIPESPTITFTEGSITDDRILRDLKNNLDYVFHLATFHGNQNSIFDPLGDHENNTLTTLKLYERLKTFKRIKKIIYASAGCTVAEKTFDKANATTEESPVSLYLDSPYQISKIIGEFYSNYYFKQHHLPIVKVRFQNVYGPGEILGAGKWRGTSATVWRNVIPIFIYRALRRMPLIVENSGIATRDFIYIDDIVRGLILCAEAGKPGEVYNLASGVETSIKELALLVNKLTGNLVPIQYGPRRKWDQSGRRFGSTLKAMKEIGFESRINLNKGLADTIEWTQQNMLLIEACIKRHSLLLEQIPVR